MEWLTSASFLHNRCCFSWKMHNEEAKKQHKDKWLTNDEKLAYSLITIYIKLSSHFLFAVANVPCCIKCQLEAVLLVQSVVLVEGAVLNEFNNTSPRKWRKDAGNLFFFFKCSWIWKLHFIYNTQHHFTLIWFWFKSVAPTHGTLNSDLGLKSRG